MSAKIKLIQFWHYKTLIIKRHKNYFISISCECAAQIYAIILRLVIVA